MGLHIRIKSGDQLRITTPWGEIFHSRATYVRAKGKIDCYLDFPRDYKIERVVEEIAPSSGSRTVPNNP